MVQKYGDFLNESKSNVSLTYSVITALAIFKPEFFEFLNSNKNRYFLTDNSFWQGLILEIKKTTQVRLDKQHLINIKGISVERDWNKLKKCVEAANKIKEKFEILNQIRILNDGGIVINNTLIQSKNNNHKITTADINDFLGFTERKIYTHPRWDMLIKKWVELVKSNLLDSYKTIYIEFLDNIGDIDWNNYVNFKLPGLGIKVLELPKLYYRSFYDLNVDLAKNPKCYIDYNKFIEEYLNLKNELLNKGILLPLIKEHTDRYSKIENLLSKHYGISEESYFRFDNKMNIIEIPSKDNFYSNLNKDVKEKFFTNNSKDFNINLKVDDNDILITINTKYLAPSFIQSKCKIKPFIQDEL